MHYFCVHGAADLAGFEQNQFWGTLVLQYSQEFPPVKQAVIALSTIHLDHVNSESTPSPAIDASSIQWSTWHSVFHHVGCRKIPNAPDREPTANAIMQYHKAVRYLRRYLETSQQPSLAAVLIAIILLHHFDVLRADDEAAMAHLDNGLRLLREHCKDIYLTTLPNASQDFCVTRSQTSTVDLSTMRPLAQVLMRLDNQASTYDYERPPSLNVSPRSVRSGQASCVPYAGFETLYDAMVVLDVLQNWLWNLLYSGHSFKTADIHDIPAEIMEQKRLLHGQIEQWAAAIAKLKHRDAEKRERNPTSAEVAGMKRLKILQLSMQMVLRGCMPLEALPFEGGPGTPAIEVLDLIHDLRGECDKTPSGCWPPDQPAPALVTRRTFSSETSMLAPLLLIAKRTMDGVVQGRAIQQLLKFGGKREGFISGTLIVKMIGELMGMISPTGTSPEYE